jgi:hypothetical protein
MFDPESVPEVPPPPEGAGEPPGQVAIGTQTLTWVPLKEVSLSQTVPVPQPAAGHAEAQKLSPWIWAQMPPPQSELERHAVHGGTVEVPPPCVMGTVLPSAATAPTTPPSAP